MQLNVRNVFQNVSIQLKILKTTIQCRLAHFENCKKLTYITTVFDFILHFMFSSQNELELHPTK